MPLIDLGTPKDNLSDIVFSIKFLFRNKKKSKIDENHFLIINDFVILLLEIMNYREKSIFLSLKVSVL